MKKMKIVVTGSLGNISKPLIQALVQKGHSVTVISSKPERKIDIEKIGAKAAIGSMEDVDFLTSTFKDADIVYCMATNDMNVFFDHSFDIYAYYNQIGKNYQKAIEQSGVKRVIYLSTIGAHTDKGNGILRFHYDIESILNKLPSDVSIKFMRPVGFYTNLLREMETVKGQAAIIQNYGGDDKEPWVSPLDIASAIAEEIEKPFEGRTIRYIASEEISPNEIAKVLGEATGTPNLQWHVVSDEELFNAWVAIGFNKEIAKGYIEMKAAQGTKVLYEDYYKNLPVLGKTKFADFAIEFAKNYNQ
jgi:uncharacterized protein YbjT (DUF2867 family)